MKRIDVACAVIVNQGKLLVCQRNSASDHPFEWEFPGGKVEHGESPEECIVREIKEELSIDIVIEKQLKPIDYDYCFKSIRLIPFCCKIIKGEPIALEHEMIKWHPVEYFAELKWSWADSELFYLNQAEIACLHC